MPSDGRRCYVPFNSGAAMVAALERVRDSGRKLVLVTGREVDDLVRAFPRLDLSIGSENDDVFLRASEYSVAVANALPSVKKGVDWTTSRSRGSGVEELAHRLLTAERNIMPPGGRW